MRVLLVLLGRLQRDRRLRKVAAVVVELEVVEVDDVSGDGVKEVAVVRHHYQRLLPPLQVLLRAGRGAGASASTGAETYKTLPVTAWMVPVQTSIGTR